MNATDILISIRKIVRSVNLESKRIDKEMGVSIPQLLCLDFLNRQPQFKASAKELKEFLQLNASTVTGIIQRLEQKGFIAKLPKAEDKRVTLITLTSRGADVLQNRPSLLQDKLAAKLASLPQEELNDIAKAIALITNLMEVHDLDASPVLTSETQLHKD